MNYNDLEDKRDYDFLTYLWIVTVIFCSFLWYLLTPEVDVAFVSCFYIISQNQGPNYGRKQHKRIKHHKTS